MAKDIVEKIRQAEQKAEDILSDAKKQAKEILAESNAEINRMNNQATINAGEYEKQVLEGAKSKADKIKEDFSQKAQKQIKTLQDTANINRLNAVKTSIDFLF